MSWTQLTTAHHSLGSRVFLFFIFLIIPVILFKLINLAPLGLSCGTQDLVP